MPRGFHVLRCGPVLALAAALCGGGCGPDLDVSKYIPPDDVALRAMTATLDSWSRGEKVGEIASDLPVKVHVVDNHRRAAQRLRTYEILGKVPGDGAVTYAVKLQFTDPDQTETVRFYLLGKDPLWVTRQEDFDLLMHWDHKMETRNAETSPSADATASTATNEVVPPAAADDSLTNDARTKLSPRGDAPK